MLNAYLNQTAEYKPCTGTDDRGQSVYGAPVTLRCRMEQYTQNILTPSGQSVQTQHVYYLTESVSEGDLLNGKVVMAVSTWRNLNGRVLGYEAVV